MGLTNEPTSFYQFYERELGRNIVRNLIRRNKEKYHAGGAYRLIVDIPSHVDSDTFYRDERLCTCVGTYEHWALFEYISPFTGNICKRGYRWEDIEEARCG